MLAKLFFFVSFFHICWQVKNVQGPDSQKYILNVILK